MSKFASQLISRGARGVHFGRRCQQRRRRARSAASPNFCAGIACAEPAKRLADWGALVLWPAGEKEMSCILRIRSFFDFDTRTSEKDPKTGFSDDQSDSGTLGLFIVEQLKRRPQRRSDS